MESLTITLPTDIRKEFDELVRKEGVSPDVVVGEAVKEYVLLHRLRSLRERMSCMREQGIMTDQDVFDRVS